MRNILFVIAALVALPSFAQVSESVEVSATNVDVVVTDAAGKPVHGLDRDGFQLFENGKRVDITNFYEEVGEAPAPSAAGAIGAQNAGVEVPVVNRRPRRLAIFIDQTSLLPVHIDRSLDSLKPFLDDLMGPEDRVMIGVWNDGFRVIQPFTSNLDEIDRSLETLRGNASMSLIYARRFERLQKDLSEMVRMGNSMQPPMSPSYAEGLSEVRSYAEEIAQKQRRMIGTLESLAAALAGAEGRKAVILLTGGATMQPGSEAFAYYDGVKALFEGGASQQPRMEAGSFRLASEFEAATRRANSAGVTIHAIRAAPMSADMVGADFNPPSGTEFLMAGTAATMEAEANRIAALQSLASSTGGTVVDGTNQLSNALDAVAGDFSSYYSLGYRPGPSDGKARRIEVRSKNRAHRVRHRTAIVDRSISEEMQQRLASALAFPELGFGMNLSVSAGEAGTPTAERRVVPVTITIPTDELTLLPDGDDLVGSFQIYTAFMRENGAVSKIVAQEQGFRFPASSRARRRAITLKLDVDVDDRTERVAVGIVDGPSRMSGVAVLELNGEAAVAE